MTKRDAASAPSDPPVVAPRRLTPKGEATRARIIEIATEVFSDEGYAGVSMRDIADRSGLSSGAIYGTFRGKAELLAEAVEAAISSDVEALPPAVMELTIPEIDAYQYEHSARRDRIRSLLLDAAVAAKTDADVRDRIRDTIGPHIEMATEAHDEWRERAGVDPDIDMRTVVMLLWSADLGLAVLEALGLDRPDSQTWSDLMRRLLKSLEAPDAHPGAPTPRPTRRRSK